MDQFDDVRGPWVRPGNQTRAGQLQDVGFAMRRVNGPLPLFPSGVRFGHLNFPVLLMNLPLSLSAQIPNNASMEDRSPSEREICLERAIEQFLRLYKHVAQHAMVYLLPSTPGLQDQPYVSNLGAVLPHRQEDTVIISRFRSAPRVGEDAVGADFFKLMNFTVERPPETFEAEPVYFEGEADLKHIHGNFYVGGHGLRTSRNALNWAAERFEMEIADEAEFLVERPKLPDIGSQRVVVGRLKLVPQPRLAVVFSIFDVFEKRAHFVDRNQVADVLGLGEPAERDADGSRDRGLERCAGP